MSWGADKERSDGGERAAASAVLLLPAPAMTFTRPWACRTQNAMTASCSLVDMVALSPVVPQTQMASTPRAIWSSMRRAKAA